MRMQNYALFLQGFRNTIKYRKSELHANADCLSRLPIKESTPEDVVDAFQLKTIETLPVTYRDLATATGKDSTSAELVQILTSGKHAPNYKFSNVNINKFTLQNGVLLRGHRVVIPERLHKQILQELHIGHFGIIKTKSIARGYV